MTSLLNNALLDLALVAGVIAAIVCVDILPSALKRYRDGGPVLKVSDFAQRKYVLVLAPFVVIVVLQQNLFAWFGFQTRDDVPFFLGFLLLIALLAAALVWWQKKSD